MAKRRFGSSDIPYADRLLIERYQTIAEHRNDAAKVAIMMLACVALNNTEGLGLTRFTRFAKELHSLINEYYDDQEVGQVHLEERLRQMGFLVKDGRMLVLENSESGEVLRVDKIGKKNDHGISKTGGCGVR